MRGGGLSRLRPHARGRAVGRRADPHPVGLLRRGEAIGHRQHRAPAPHEGPLGARPGGFAARAAARPDPDGKPLRRVRPRLLLSQSRSRRPDPRRGARSVSRGARRAPAARLLRRPRALRARARALRGGASGLRSQPSGARGGRSHRPRRVAHVPRHGPRLGRGLPAAGRRPPDSRGRVPRARPDDEVLGGLSACRSSSCRRCSRRRGSRPRRDGSPRASGGCSPSERSRSSWCSRSTPPSPGAWIAPTRRPIIREKVGVVGQAPALAEKIAAFADLSSPLAHYVGGLASVVRQNAVGGGITYLNGKVSTEGFPDYFFVAFAVKSTLAFLAVTLAILAAAVLRKHGLARGMAALRRPGARALPGLDRNDLQHRHPPPSAGVSVPGSLRRGALRPRVEPAPRLGEGPARGGGVGSSCRSSRRSRSRASIPTSCRTSTPSPGDPREAPGS